MLGGLRDIAGICWVQYQIHAANLLKSDKDRFTQ